MDDAGLGNEVHQLSIDVTALAADVRHLAAVQETRRLEAVLIAEKLRNTTVEQAQALRLATVEQAEALRLATVEQAEALRVITVEHADKLRVATLDHNATIRRETRKRGRVIYALLAAIVVAVIICGAILVDAIHDNRVAIATERQQSLVAISTERQLLCFIVDIFKPTSLAKEDAPITAWGRGLVAGSADASARLNCPTAP